MLYLHFTSEEMNCERSHIIMTAMLDSYCKTEPKLETNNTNFKIQEYS
jgi:hypothetical protein